MRACFRLLRPEQYVKNLFIFMPVFFGLKMGDPLILVDLMLAFLAFSLTASTVYILNDFCDILEDRAHPVKKMRPLASGAVTKRVGIITMMFLLSISLAVMTYLSLEAAFLMLIYFVLNVFYSFHLKHVAILDVSVISIGFLLRLFIGAEISMVDLFIWIVLMTFLLAMFLGLAKRRDDVLIFLETGKRVRKVVDGYNLKFVDSAMVIMASVVVVTYILYASSAEIVMRVNHQFFPLTTIFVLLGVMRYMQISYVFKDSGSPTKILLTDRFIQSTLVGWVIVCSWILYA